MGLKPHSLHLPHSLPLLTLWHQGTATSIRSSHIAPSLFLDRSESSAQSQWCKKSPLFVMDGRASHCGPLTVLCYRELHAYRLCLVLLWMLTVFEEIFLRPFFGISKHRLPRAPNTHTSWLQLPFPSKFNYAIIFLSLLFQVGGFESLHLKQHLL